MVSISPFDILTITITCPQTNFAHTDGVQWKLFRLKKINENKYSCECGCEFVWRSWGDWEITKSALNK